MAARVLKSVKPIHYLLLALPLAIAGNLLHWPPLLIFALASAGLIPLAELIGESTEALAVVTGPKVGGLLNATLGNAAELIITIVAIRAGLLDLVKASITGSILGNLLLVMGASLLFGGLRHGRQHFNRDHQAVNATMLVMAVVALSVPSLFNHTLGGEALPINTLESISIGVAVVMIGLYALGLVYSLRNGPAHAAEHAAPAPAGGAVAPITSGEGATALTPPGVPAAVHWSPRTAMVVLAIATAAVVWLSEILVHQVEAVTEALHLSEFFLGIILIPIIGNVAEHLVAVEVAMKNHMDLSLEIALGSSLQIALFVAPVLVFVSLLFGQYLNLVFNQFELLALIGAVVISALVASDGETNWLEGAQLLAVYLILGVAFYFLPA